MHRWTVSHEMFRFRFYYPPILKKASTKWMLLNGNVLKNGHIYCISFQFTWSFLLFEERSDLHADRFERIPRALPVHPHNAIICPMLGHIFCIRSSPVVSPIRITRVASVVPPSSSIFSWTLLRRISRYPVWDANNWKEKEHIRYCTTYPCSFQFGHH